jgi:hypothetical protein
MPATNVGIPLSFNIHLVDALAPRFVSHFGDWLSVQKTAGSEVHETLDCLERLEPHEAAETTLQFILTFFRPGLRPTPVSEIGDRLGVLAVAMAGLAGAPSICAIGALDRYYRSVGAKLVELFAESTGLVVICDDWSGQGVLMLNPETTQRDTVSSRPARRTESWDEDGGARTQRMLRALRDMRDLRERRKLRVAGY